MPIRAFDWRAQQMFRIEARISSGVSTAGYAHRSAYEFHVAVQCDQEVSIV